MSELRNKRVVVVGMGHSGVAAARLLLARGAKVVLNDAKPTAAWSEGARALAAITEAHGGGHADVGLERADLVVVSPGVPLVAELAAAAHAGVPIIGEVELAVREARPAPLVAVGGTNGKSTTTALVAALLEAHGSRVFVGGNFGEPLAAHADEAFDRLVLEVSSFQMERVDRFRPDVAVLLNVTADHLDRYANMDAYARAKGNMFLRQGPEDVAVIPVGDATCAREAARGAARRVTFGPGGDADVTSTHVTFRGERYARHELALRGGHNALNVAAALAAVERFGVDAATCRRVLTTFRGLPHRTALVAEIDGVRFYDDSKGTNVGAAVTALTGLDEPWAVLLAGGRDKGGGYGPLVSALRARGRAAVLIGEAADAIAQAIGDAVPVRRAASMQDAVAEARALAEPGDAVLLSPACSSFDMFRDYKHRGEAFADAVLALREEGKAR